MSDLIKVQNSPQFNWYTRWTSLGANGMPDKLIKEGLKQPDWIEVSFKKGAKEITGHVAPNQAWFGTEYFLAYTLPNFKSKILTQLSDTQKDNGPLLFSRLSQCFQDVGLTEWTSLIAKRCPDNADWTKDNFNKCIRDYLEAIAEFPTLATSWFAGSVQPRNPPSCQCTSSCGVKCSFSATYLESGYLRWTMEVPTAQEKSEQFSLRSLRCTRTSLPT